MKVLESLKVQYRTLVCVAALADVEEAFELYHHIPPQDEKSLVEATREILSLPPKERKKRAMAEIHRVGKRPNIHPMVEVHTGWFLEAIQKENIQTIAIILSLLPKEKAKLILEELPQETQERLTNIQLLGISDDLIDLILSRFDSVFTTLCPPTTEEEISLKHLYYLSTEKIVKLLKDVGVLQIARVFQELEKEALKAFANRLSVEDAKHFYSIIKNLGAVSPKELREAQMLLVQLPVERISPDQLFLEMGLLFLVKALGPEDIEFLQAFSFKLSPKLGYLLRRYFDENVSTTTPQKREWFSKQMMVEFQKLV